MGNNICPICKKKTEGKAVRRVNFCKTHRELAIFLRDHGEIKEYEHAIGRTLWDSEFAKMVESFVRDANVYLKSKDLRIVGT